MENLLIYIAAALATAAVCQWIAWRMKLPAIIFLLLAGILAGPVLGVLNPEELMGDFFFPFVSLSVAIILFEGSLTLHFREALGLQKVVRNLVSAGILITWLITALTARFAVGLSWETAILFGAITVVTGPTVIVPMLRTVRPTAAVSNILRWEGVIIDPIGASLAVLVYEYIISSGTGMAWGHTMAAFGAILGIGLAIGAVSGYLFGLAIRNHWIPEFLQNASALALVVAVFAVSNRFQAESGLVTVTVMGIWLANMKEVDLEDILDFKETLSIVLISLLFIVLAARVDFNSFAKLGWGALLVFLAIQFLARPISVMVSTVGSKLSWPERHLLAWIAPRGIVAAAISALFALQLEKAGYADVDLLVPLTFMVIIGTVLLQSFSARPIARLLGVAEPEPKGFLIVGANAVARAIARGLIQNDCRVLMVDTSWENISKAKMEGVRTYFGNPISEHAYRHLDLVGIGRMLGLSRHWSINMAAVIHYRLEFGRKNVFMLRAGKRNASTEKRELPEKRRGQSLFGEGITFATLNEAIERGGEVSITRLSRTFGFHDLMNKAQGTVIPLFAEDIRGRVHVFTEQRKISPQAGWSVISLTAPKSEVTPADEDRASDS